MKNFLHKHCRKLVVLCIAVLLEPVSAEVATGIDEQTGLRSWEWTEADVSIQMVQRLPDQTRAFFQGRGFSSSDADTIARSCVFQTIFRNDGKRPLTYDLDDWRIISQGQQNFLITRERWEQKWPEGEVSQAARIALRWSLLPTRQDFESGDYNWGMTSFGLPPGESFDLTLVVTIKNEVITRNITGIVCASERASN